MRAILRALRCYDRGMRALLFIGAVVYAVLALGLDANFLRGFAYLAIPFVAWYQWLDERIARRARALGQGADRTR